MKRYLLFKGDYYYPSGGWDDFVKDFDWAEEAKKEFNILGDCKWMHLVDTESFKTCSFQDGKWEEWVKYETNQS